MVKVNQITELLPASAQVIEVRQYEVARDDFNLGLPESQNPLATMVRKQEQVEADWLVHYLEEFDTGICGYERNRHRLLEE